LVTQILAAKELDGGDRVLAKSVAEQLIHALRMQERRKGAMVWTLNPSRLALI
jgi:hypothetical protein